MMSLTFGLFTQVSGLGPLGPLVSTKNFGKFQILTFENLTKQPGVVLYCSIPYAQWYNALTSIVYCLSYLKLSETKSCLLIQILLFSLLRGTKVHKAPRL